MLPTYHPAYLLRNPDKKMLINALREAEFLISERSGRIDKEIIQNAPQLRLIQRLGIMVLTTGTAVIVSLVGTKEQMLAVVIH